MRSKKNNHALRRVIRLTVAALLAVAGALCIVGCNSGKGGARSETDWAYEIVSDSGIRVTGCRSGEDVPVIPETIDGLTVTVIGSEAFAGGKISGVKLPGTVRTVEDSAFANCASLKEIDMSSVAVIGKQAFSGCTSLKTVKLGEELNEIGAGAFEGCEKLTAIVIPSSVRVIPERAFSGCKSLTEATFSDGIAEIGAYAFSDCAMLRDPVLPVSLQSIGEFAFLSCQSIEIAEVGNIKYGRGVWMDCRRLKNVAFAGNTDEIGDYLFAGCVSLTKISIPSGVTSIGESSFRLCTGLKRAEIPSTVSNIGRNAFSGCDSLVIAAPELSAAQRYAVSFGIKYEKVS